jgi:hypothetical protein
VCKDSNYYQITKIKLPKKNNLCWSLYFEKMGEIVADWGFGVSGLRVWLRLYFERWKIKYNECQDENILLIIWFFARFALPLQRCLKN